MDCEDLDYVFRGKPASEGGCDPQRSMGRELESVGRYLDIGALDEVEDHVRHVPTQGVHIQKHGRDHLDLVPVFHDLGPGPLSILWLAPTVSQEVE
jgi:hypothetical protein